MKFKNYVFGNPFTVHGIFTFNKSEVLNGINGNLIYDGEEITLQTFGCLNNKSFFSLFEDLPQTTVYGFDSNANLLILKVEHRAYGQINNPGFPVLSHRVREVKIINVFYSQLGINSNDNKDLLGLINEIEYNNEVIYINLSFNHLENWIGKSVSFMQFNEDTRDSTLGVNLSEYTPTEIHIDKYDIWLRDILMTTNIYDELQIKKSYFLQLYQKDSKSISYTNAFDLTKKIKQFIEMTSDVALNYTAIDILYKFHIIDKLKIPLIKGKLLFPQSNINKKIPLNKFEGNKLNQIEDEFENAFNKWMDIEDDFNFIINQYLSSLHKDHYLENKFVDIVGILEVFHRTFINNYSNRNLTHEEIEKNKEILRKIETVIDDKDILENFTYQLTKTKKHVILFDRLTNLFTELPEELRLKYFTNDEGIDEFVKKLRDTRNYFVHGGKKGKYFIESIDEMYEKYNKCKKILEYYLRTEIGLKPIKD